MYGKWEDSFIMINAFKEEIRNKNPGSVVDTDFEISGNKKCFQRFFSSLAACSRGFILGCRPYISLDGCHLKGKFNGVLVAATGIDGNNSIFPVAYGVLESENTKSWTWFLNLLKEAIGTPNGLVISSDMQKGLEVAISEVYPNAIRYLNDNHKKIWSVSKFGTISKCDYITNNISESFNSWIGELRYQPVINLLDAIIERLMVRFDNKRRIVEKWKGNIVPTAKKYLNEISKNLGD
ncbi:hypothetical protein Tco_0769767 [Tanacetum coccineum]|uniref:MULE transposase domain-containing protein n=1 Tax=Tanacetum coccineum TaxID=301880 RepID=A0ABQ4ZC60_9ASTR